MSAEFNPTNGLGGANDKLAGPAKNLDTSDDVVTYRYEFYEHVGPYDTKEPPTHVQARLAATSRFPWSRIAVLRL